MESIPGFEVEKSSRLAWSPVILGSQTVMGCFGPEGTEPVVSIPNHEPFFLAHQLARDNLISVDSEDTSDI